MICSTYPPTTVYGGETSSTSLLDIHPDILQSHILTRVDGPTLISAACTSTELRTLATREDLWTNICFSTWPSTNSPRLHPLISSFPQGARSFFSQSFPAPHDAASTAAFTQDHDHPSELISAVDVYYRDELIFSKVVETQTVSGWFCCSPFRIDMLDPKDTCPTSIPHVEDTCRELAEELTLSWILIDPTKPRAMNVSSQKPVSVRRHWLSGEVHARFSVIIMGGGGGSSTEFVQCGIVVTCGGGAEGGGMHVREVSLQVEDMDGMFLSGKDSLGILSGGFEGKKGIVNGREMEVKRRYEEFLEMKRERKERKMRSEGRLDMLHVAFGVLSFASLGLFVLFR